MFKTNITFWNWPFLADLASPDHFFWESPEPFKFLLWNITGINLLPLITSRRV